MCKKNTQIFDNVSWNYLIAILLGGVTGISFVLFIGSFAPPHKNIIVITLTLLASMLISGLCWLQHRNHILKLRRKFLTIENKQIPSSTWRMILAVRTTVKGKIDALSGIYYLFWVAGFGCGLGLFGVLWKLLLGSGLMEIKGGLVAIGVIVLSIGLFKVFLFRWDITYLEKLYHENINDKSNTYVPPSEIVEHADSEQIVLKKGAKRGLFLRYICMLALSFPGYWLAEIYLGFVRANYTVDAGFDRSLFLLIIPTVFISAVNYVERWILWEKVNWFDLKGVDHMVPITMGLAIGYVLSLGLIRLGIMFIEAF